MKNNATDKTSVSTSSEAKETSSSEASPVIARINVLEKNIANLQKKTTGLEEKAEKINFLVKESEKKTDRISTFVMIVATGIMIAFLLALIPFCVDYFKTSYERYEKYIKRVDKLEFRISNMENNLKSDNNEK